MKKYQFLYFERVLHTKIVEAENPEQACNKFMEENTIDQDDLTIDYEVRDEETGEDIDISRIKSVQGFV